MTGWDLVAAAQERIGDFWSLTRSQVYRELRRMADDGLVRAGPRGRRDRRRYELTDAVTVTYEAARAGMGRLMRREGFAAGISTGANVEAAQRIARESRPNDTILTFAYDHALDYPTILEEMVTSALT